MAEDLPGAPARRARSRPEELIATWKKRFPEFWPEGNTFYAPLTGIEPGEVALIGMTLPGKMKLSTGVMVLYADEESFTLMTPQGHMFAGWITFSATARDGETVAQAQVLMRASDPIFEMGLTFGGHRQEDRFWNHTLSSVAAHFGDPGAEVDTQVVCVDKKRQWSQVAQRLALVGHPLDDVHDGRAGPGAPPAVERPDSPWRVGGFWYSPSSRSGPRGLRARRALRGHGSGGRHGRQSHPVRDIVRKGS